MFLEIENKRSAFDPGAGKDAVGEEDEDADDMRGARPVQGRRRPRRLWGYDHAADDTDYGLRAITLATLRLL